MKNTFGSSVCLTIFGESHGPAIGAVLDGLCAGLPVDEAFIARQMDKRRARGDGLSTGRTEADQVRLLSGVLNGRTTGTAIALMIENKAQRSGDSRQNSGSSAPRPRRLYRLRQIRRLAGQPGRRPLLRPHHRPAGGGGAICQQVLAAKGITIATHIRAAAGVEDLPFAADESALLAGRPLRSAPLRPSSWPSSTPPGRSPCGPPSGPPGPRATAWAAFWKPPCWACPPGWASLSLTVWSRCSATCSSAFPP